MLHMDKNHHSSSNAAGGRTRRRRPRHDPPSPDHQHHIASVASPGAIESPPIVTSLIEAASAGLSMSDLNANSVLVHNHHQPTTQRDRHRHPSHHHRVFLWVLLLCAVPLPVILYVKNNTESTHNSLFFSSSSSSSRTSSRSLRLPYLIRQHTDAQKMMADAAGDGNVGGWLVSAGRKSLPEMMEEPNAGLADYGGLVFLSLRTSPTFQRSIRQQDFTLYNAEKSTQIKSMNEEYISKRHWFDDELEDIENDCRRPNWEKGHFPLCNAFHEIDLSRNYDVTLAQRSGDNQAGDSFYLSHGYFRDVFALNRNEEHAKAVLKVARYTKHEMNYRPMYNAKRDALIMERLSGSPKIVDIYGHCGSSVMVESLPNEVQEHIVAGGGWIKHEDLKDSEDVDIQNNYTIPEKLYLALEMAESIAVLHGFKDGVIVHDDIQLCQWLRNDDGKLKLGDFNRARVLAWNDAEQEYCTYDNGRGYGNYRSPEEYGEKPLLQTHDVWSFGNNIYALISGLWIFYEDEDDEVVSEKIVNGSTAFIDDRYRTRSYIEGRLVELMEKCWVYDMDKRITIFEAVEFLRETVREHERREGKK